MPIPTFFLFPNLNEQLQVPHPFPFMFFFLLSHYAYLCFKHRIILSLSCLGLVPFICISSKLILSFILTGALGSRTSLSFTHFPFVFSGCSGSLFCALWAHQSLYCYCHSVSCILRVLGDVSLELPRPCVSDLREADRRFNPLVLGRIAISTFAMACGPCCHLIQHISSVVRAWVQILFTLASFLH